MSTRNIKCKRVQPGMYIRVPSTGFYGVVDDVQRIHDGIVVITFLEGEVYNTYDDEIVELISDDSESVD